MTGESGNGGKGGRRPGDAAGPSQDRARRGFSGLHVAVTALALACQFLATGGCGGDGTASELLDLLRERAGTVSTLRYTCVTEDGERLYREEFELAFPDRYRYRLYENAEGEPRLVNVAVQRGVEAFRARASYGDSGRLESLEAVTYTGIPPLRNTGAYLGLYHMLGNADYFHSLSSLIEGGSLELAGRESVEGAPAYRLRSSPGLKPEISLWLDETSGLPLKKELVLGEGRTLVFLFRDYEEGFAYGEEPFPPDVRALFGTEGLAASPGHMDAGCLPVNPQEAAAFVAFSPRLPELPGFTLAEAWWRDPAVSAESEGERSFSFPEGFREIYLLYRDGPRQVEIRECPYHPDFGYYTMGMGTLTGAYLTQQEVLDAAGSDALYTVALDCQEMHQVAGGLEITVTGDLSRDGFAALAARLTALASSPE